MPMQQIGNLQWVLTSSRVYSLICHSWCQSTSFAPNLGLVQGLPAFDQKL